MAASGTDRARAAFALLLASMALHGCSLVLDVDGEQCSRDSDCVGLFGRSYVCTDQRVCIDSSELEDDASVPDDAGGLPSRWRCIEEPPRPVNPQNGRVVTVSMGVTDFVDLRVPEGLVGRACNPTDVMCSRPFIDNVTVDDEGYLDFDVPHGFSGFFEIEAPGYLETIVSSNKLYTGDDSPEGVTLLTEQSLRQISEGGGEEIDEMEGIVLLAVYDCDGNPAEGVVLKQDIEAVGDEPLEHPFYFEGSLPDRDLDATAISRGLNRAMSPLAVGGFSRVKKGYATMIGVLASTGQEIGRAEVQVRPLAMTITELHAGY